MMTPTESAALIAEIKRIFYENGSEPTIFFRRVERYLAEPAQPAEPTDGERRFNEDGPLHYYVIHHTYTGSGCAICGLPESHRRHAMSAQSQKEPTE
jgi:hypothetical protein